MSQHDFNIANQGAAAARADINNALIALATTSSGVTAPANTYANMMWYDTTANILKMRNEADSAWINLGTLNQGANTFSTTNATNLTGTSTSNIPTAALATGTANTTSYLRGDRTWQVVSTTLTTEQVLAATANGLSKAVGTEIVAWNNSATGISVNGTIAGSSIYYSVNISSVNPMDTITQSSGVPNVASNIGLPLTGTWRARTACPGKFQSGDDRWNFIPTLWLRIS